MTDAEALAAHKEGNFNWLVRPERDKLLLESDWTQGADSLSDSKKQMENISSSTSNADHSI